MTNRVTILLSSLLVLTACATRAPSLARPSVDVPASVAPVRVTQEAEQKMRGAKGHKEELRHHSFSAFLGDTFEANENGITAGLDYEYRINHLVGVGAFVDRAWGDFNSTLFGGAVFVHPWRDLILMGGLGSERADGENKFAGRLGLGYEFPIVDRYSVIPWAYLDFAEGEGAHSGVVGVGFGVGF